MATATRARHGSYIFQRPGSANWYVKLRSRTGRVERSLGTSDKLEAERLAAPLIGDHKAALLAARPHLEMARYKLEPQPKPGDRMRRLPLDEADMMPRRYTLGAAGP